MHQGRKPVIVLAQVDVAVVWLCSSLKSPQRDKGSFQASARRRMNCVPTL